MATAKVAKAVKKVSANSNGLTIGQLENEIFKIEGLRVVIRARPSLRSGTAKYGRRLPADAKMEDLTERLERYFKKSKDADELHGVYIEVIDPSGKAHRNTVSTQKKLSEVVFA